MASKLIEVFLLRPICGDAGTFAASTIQEFDEKYALELIKKKLAEKATKANRKKADAIKRPIINPKDQKLPEGAEDADAGADADADAQKENQAN